MQLNQYKFLVAIDQFGSISKAAQELYLSQSTISLAIINLEEELGITILHRSKKGVEFTEKGQKVLTAAKEMMAIVQNVQNIKFESVSELSGQMKLTHSLVCLMVNQVFLMRI